MPGWMKLITRMNVAPVTGAWIETSAVWCTYLMRSVAPVTGAWIETAMSRSSL